MQVFRLSPIPNVLISKFILVSMSRNLLFSRREAKVSLRYCQKPNMSLNSFEIHIPYQGRSRFVVSNPGAAFLLECPLREWCLRKATWGSDSTTSDVMSGCVMGEGSRIAGVEAAITTSAIRFREA